MAPAGSARIVEALVINSGRAKSRRPGAPLETQPGLSVRLRDWLIDDCVTFDGKEIAAERAAGIVEGALRHFVL